MEKQEQNRNRSRRGRPSKYKRSLCKRVDEITALLRTEAGAKDFFKYCGVEHIAIHIGVVKDTIYEWVKIHPEFSDAMKRWVDQRNAVFYTAIGSVPNACWIFLSKNWLNMTDRQLIRLRPEEEDSEPGKQREDDYTDEELLKIASRGIDRSDKTPTED